LARRCELALDSALLYREVEAERDAAQQANRLKDECLATLYHAKNPLSELVRWTRILKDAPAITRDPAVTEGLKSMERNVAALTTLVGESVDLARIAQQKIRIERAEVNLNQIVMIAVEASRERAAELGLAMEVELTAEPSRVFGDATHLKRVVTNLLTNAFNHTNRAGRVTVRTVLRGEEIEIEVTDTGTGIAQVFHEQTSEPLHQDTHSWLKAQSELGLELAVARRIVEMHGGKVWVESTELGCGSSYRVRLPRSATVGGGREGIKGQHSTTRRSLRILLIDDSEDILTIMKIELELLGHTVITARNGSLALDIAVATVPDLVISDLKMPLFDGYQLIRKIRSLPALADIPAIALTGFGSLEEIERALMCGFDACLSKPSEPDQMAALIDRLIENRAAGSPGT